MRKRAKYRCLDNDLASEYTYLMKIDIKGITSVTLSKPCSLEAVERALGRSYIKIKIMAATTCATPSRAYFVEKFTATQAFHEHISREALSALLDECVGTLFLNCVVRTDVSETSYYTGKDGKVSCRRRNALLNTPSKDCASGGRNYILKEGAPVPFLVRLGIMTDTGKVVQSKYDKFKQINRFLEYVDDIVRTLSKRDNSAGENKGNGGETRCIATSDAKPFRVVDLGCGKAYLTFAIHYYLTRIRCLKASITGIDVKADVVEYCNTVAKELRCDGLHFQAGDIADYSGETPDLVVALHACDTATDEALAFAVRSNARAILSAPCCQHELFQSLHPLQGAGDAASPFAPLLRYGLLRERFAAIATDALRAEYLEASGYAVQVLEFIDMEHTPKNLLIRAVKKAHGGGKASQKALDEANALTDSLGVSIRLSEIQYNVCA